MKKKIAAGSNWTTPHDLTKQILRLWDRGLLLTSGIDPVPAFPHRLSLKTPTSAELADEFPAVREWIQNLREGTSAGYRIVWKEIRHRTLGRNSIPQEAWIDSADTALAWIRKKTEMALFQKLLQETQSRNCALLPWLARHPHRALELAEIWTQLLDVLAWIQAHPSPGIYLRQMDIPGIHTKFIESRRGVLSELLDLVLPPEAVHQEFSGISGFCRRYGFRDKPLRIRFRILDPALRLLPDAEEQDIALTQNDFSRLRIPIRQVFITENETNFLSFPLIRQSLVIFGAGYGFEAFAGADWMHHCGVYYWGDIDTHGFAILNQLRSLLPHAKSLLMDRETLLHHRQHWTQEAKPEKRELSRLTPPEKQIYDALRHDLFETSVRLEQERIEFSWVTRALHWFVLGF